MAWEHEYEKFNAGDPVGMVASLDGWAAEGWELHSLTPIGEAVGDNTLLLALLRRHKAEPSGNAPTLAG